MDGRPIACVIGTRPEAVKMAPVVGALRRRDRPVALISTGQHRELVHDTLACFGLRSDIDLDLMSPGQSPAEVAGRALTALDGVLAELQPSLVLAQGDTASVFAAAMAAFYRQIPFGHVEAGLRTGRHDPFPEEMHRVLVARAARLHFCPTSQARDNLLREGAAADGVHVTGNTVIDALQWMAGQALPEPPDCRPDEPLLLVTAHRRENLGRPLEEICEALQKITASRPVQVLFPLHPNPQVQATVRRVLGAAAADGESSRYVGKCGSDERSRIRLCPPLSYRQFVGALRRAHLVLTDSGGIQEEAPALGKPVLVLRESTERTEGIQCGAAALVGCRRDRIVARTLELLDNPSAWQRMAQARLPYGDGRAAERIAEVVQRHLQSGPDRRAA